MTMTPAPLSEPSPDELTADPADAAARRLRAQRAALAQPRSWLALIPRGSLVRVAVLLAILMVIVALQRQSGSIVKRLTEGLFPAPPAAQLPAPEGHRVRLAAPVTGP